MDGCPNPEAPNTGFPNAPAPPNADGWPKGEGFWPRLEVEPKGDVVWPALDGCPKADVVCAGFEGCPNAGRPNPGTELWPKADACVADPPENGFAGVFRNGFPVESDVPLGVLLDALDETFPLAISILFGWALAPSSMY